MAAASFIDENYPLIDGNGVLFAGKRPSATLTFVVEVSCFSYSFIKTHKMNAQQNGATCIVPTINTTFQDQVKSSSDILFIEAAHVYIEVYQVDGKRHLVRHSLTSFLDQLPSNLFIQTHRSFIVNLNRVTAIGNHSLTLGRHSVPVSRSRWNDVMKAVKAFRDS